MISDVGIKAGMVLDNLGTPSEIAAFFALIDRHKRKSSDGALNLVTDRLFRRTVQGEHFDALERQLAESRQILRSVQIVGDFWDEFDLGSRAVGIDRSATNAADAFQRVYDVLIEAINVARLDQKNLGYIRPLRLMAWEGPKSYEHEYMKPEEFEEPDMRPIWLE
jgi:hypothetical protein